MLITLAAPDGTITRINLSVDSDDARISFLATFYGMEFTLRGSKFLPIVVLLNSIDFD